MSIEVGIDEVVVEVVASPVEVTIDVVNPIVEVRAVTNEVTVGVVSSTVDVDVIAASMTVDVAQPVIDVSVVPGSGGVTDHNELKGLTADDHPQYLTSDRGDLLYSRLYRRIDFPIPNATWVIDIGTLCYIIVYDSSKRVVEPGTIEATGSTELTLTFSAPFSGVAYCYN